MLPLAKGDSTSKSLPNDPRNDVTPDHLNVFAVKSKAIAPTDFIHPPAVAAIEIEL